MTEEVVLILQRMLAITDTGLAFGSDAFDKARYAELRDLLAGLIEQTALLDRSEVTDLLRPVGHYATPLIDTRALVVNSADEILLVKDRRDATWALPGGFGEVGISVKENILKELKEEAGVEAKVDRLLAIFDSNKHQLQATQFFKLCFLCTALATEFEPNTEITEVAYFAVDQLPDLSTKRITRRQLEILMKHYKAGGQVYLD